MQFVIPILNQNTHDKLYRENILLIEFKRKKINYTQLFVFPKMKFQKCDIRPSTIVQDVIYSPTPCAKN